MNKTFTFFSAAVLTVIFATKTQNASAQIITYVDDTLGALSMTDPNATATPLNRVNGAIIPASICHNGFSSKGFNSPGAFADSFKAVEVDVTPNSGHTLSVTGFTADLRRSNTGPVSARYAYSTDGGTTWTNQGSDQTPMHAGCDTLTTITWTTPVVVAAPSTLKFRVYGYAASAATGTFQIKNLSVNGAVTGPVSVSELEQTFGQVLVTPNPVSENGTITYSLNDSREVEISLFNILGQKVQDIATGVQARGGHSFNFSMPSSGVYFVRIRSGNQTQTLRVEKI